MNNQPHTAAWKVQTWISFIVSSIATSTGILFLPVDIWIKAFLGMGLLFTVGSCFSLAKTVRDEHEADKDIRYERARERSGPFRNTA